MLPQIVGPGTFTPSPLASSVAERRDQGAQPDVGETAAAAARPEGANRVDPAKVIPATLSLPEDRRRPDPLVPPDPEAPAGPPPAFDATPLERAREAAFAPADLIGGGGRAEDTSRRASETDDRLREKMEAEIAGLRRMARPEADRTVDVTR